jgi:hypothetical protein
VFPPEDLAQVEGLAAGTGLLTGDVAERRARTSGLPTAPCPHCGKEGDVSVLDLVDHRLVRTCAGCHHRWTADDDFGGDLPRD